MASQRFNRSDHVLRSSQGVDWYVKFEGEQTHIGAEQDCTHIIEANKRDQNSGHSGWSSDKTFRHAARIPVVVQFEWMTKHGVNLNNPDHYPAVRRLLNSSEYRYLRPFEWKL